MPWVDFDLINRLAPLAKFGDGYAKEDLMAAAYPFVTWIINTKRLYLPSGGDRYDLEQEGMIGVIEALEDWDQEMQPLFTYFARLCVERQMLTLIITQNREMRRAQNEATSLDAPAGRDKYGDEGEADRVSRWDLPDTSGLGIDPAEVVAGTEADQLLGGFTEGLTDLERHVFLKCLLGGEDYRNVAADLGRRDKSVDNALQRVRRKAIRRAPELATDVRFTPGTRALIRRYSNLAGAARRRRTDEELRATLPVETLTPSGLVRFSLTHNQWTVPADRLLQEYPDIHRYAVTPTKQTVLEGYLAGRPWSDLATAIGSTVGACKHHLRRICEKAAKDRGMVRPRESSSTPLYQRVEQLWAKGISISDIEQQLSYVATSEKVQSTLNQLYQRRRRQQLNPVPDHLETRRIPLVRLGSIPSLLRKAQPLLIPERIETLKLYMQGYSQVEIAQRRGVAHSSIGKNDLPMIRRALRNVNGFEWLYDKRLPERQVRILALEAIGVTVEEALERVPPQHVEMYKLYLNGYSVREIDEELGLTAGRSQRNLHYCRSCVRRQDDFRKQPRRNNTPERDSARRIRKNQEAHRRYQAIGHLLDPDRRKALDLYFRGVSIPEILGEFGLEPNRTTRRTLWSQVKRAGEILKELDDEQTPGHRVRRHA